MSFIYDTYAAGIVQGFAAAPSTWSFFLALVRTGYVPNQLTDATLADIGGGNIANNGQVHPILTYTFPGQGMHGTVPVSNKWVAVAAGADVNAVVLYGTFMATNQLIAYYNTWAGLPFTPDGTDVTLVSLPTALGTGENLFRIGTPT